MSRKNEKEIIFSEDNAIKKSNELSISKIGHGFTLNQMQLLSYAIYSTQKNEKTSFQKKDFEKKFNIEKYMTSYIKEDMEFFDKALVSLIDIVKLDEEFIKKKSIKIFREIEYNKGTFTFEWDRELLPHIINLKERYVWTDLTITSKFKSGFSWILYDFLRGLYGHWRKVISKESALELFDVSDYKSYIQNTGLFKSKVLNVAISEINNHTELEVKYSEKKKGRRIVGFELIWSSGKMIKQASDSQINMLGSILKQILDDSYEVLSTLENKDKIKEVILIVNETKEMNNYIKDDVSITFSRADLLIKQAKYNLRNLHALKNNKKDVYYNWLEEDGE